MHEPEAVNEPPAATRSASARAKIEPVAIKSGEPVLIRIWDAVELAGRAISVIVFAQDSVSQHFIASIPATLDSEGNGTAEFTSGSLVGEETAVWVTQLSAEDLAVDFELVSLAFIDSPVAVTDSSAVERFHEVLTRHELRFDVPIVGGRTGENNEHRAIYIVDRLLISETIRLPGVVVEPIPTRPAGADFREAITAAAEKVGWPGRPPETWEMHFGSQHPMVAVVMAQILASDYAAAGIIADKTLRDVLDVLSIARSSRGVPVISLLESKTNSEGVHPRFRFLTPGYNGNLLTGPIAGESAHDILRMYEALHADPKIRLAVAMYGEALADSDLDARYYRLWAMIEVLSAGFVSPGQRVTLEDGTAWPDGATTSQAAPRVYEYIRSIVIGVNLESVARPASSLYELVRSWYGRRNATVHYGRFLENDPEQIAANWYVWAARTKTTDQGMDTWILAAQAICDLVLRQALLQRN